MSKFDYEIFVIGAGSAGVRAARLASSMGKTVGIAEEYRYGGTCVIRGCVPKKLMVYAADFRDHLNDAVGFGWKVGNSHFSWKNFSENKDKEVSRLEMVYLKNLKEAGVAVFHARAKLIDTNKIELSDGTTCTAETIIVATGGRPFVPEFPGSEYVLTSDEIFDLKTFPARILIVGGGYIACEFSGIFDGMGSKVTQIYRGEQVLRGFDQDLRSNLMQSMIERGIEIKCLEEIVKIQKAPGGLKVFLKSGSEIFTNCVLSATGRVPNTNDLGLEDLQVELNTDGAMVVDSVQRSSIKSIFGLGDVTNRLNLTPVAIRDAMAAVETIANNNPTSPDHQLVPTAVFTRPEIATVGLPAHEIPVNTKTKTYVTKFRPMYNILAGRNEKTFMKLIVEEDGEKVLGCHLLGPGSAEMIQLAAIAVKMGAT